MSKRKADDMMEHSSAGPMVKLLERLLHERLSHDDIFQDQNIRTLANEMLEKIKAGVMSELEASRWLSLFGYREGRSTHTTPMEIEGGGRRKRKGKKSKRSRKSKKTMGKR